MKYLLAFLLFFHLHASEEDVDALLKPVLSTAGLLQTRQIKIPGYPNAYNPSLIPYKGGYLLSFRYISRWPDKYKNPLRTDASFIGLARLDKHFKVSARSIQLLNVVSHSPTFSLTAEDARLFTIDNRTYLFFNDLPQTHGKFAMYFAEITEEQNYFFLKEPAKPLYYPDATPIEKNWTPFFTDRLYLIYADRPRLILEVNLATGHCHAVSRPASPSPWPWGEIRGGTPALPLNDSLLTFFHSSFPAPIPKGRAFVMGAYLFDATPPFALRALSPAPIGALSYYTEDNSTKIIFPAGLVIQDRHIHVAWGKADKQIFITTFDRDALLASLIPCAE